MCLHICNKLVSCSSNTVSLPLQLECVFVSLSILVCGYTCMFISGGETYRGRARGGFASKNSLAHGPLKLGYHMYITCTENLHIHSLPPDLSPCGSQRRRCWPRLVPGWPTHRARRQRGRPERSRWRRLGGWPLYRRGENSGLLELGEGIEVRRSEGLVQCVAQWSYNPYFSKDKRFACLPP